MKTIPCSEHMANVPGQLSSVVEVELYQLGLEVHQLEPEVHRLGLEVHRLGPEVHWLGPELHQIGPEGHEMQLENLVMAFRILVIWPGFAGSVAAVGVVARIDFEKPYGLVNIPTITIPSAEPEMHM